MKNCPQCKKQLENDVYKCSCGYDFDGEECPSCDTWLSSDQTVCHVCQYNLIDGTPGKKVPKKPEKVEKPEKTKKKSEPSAVEKAVNRFGLRKVMVAATHQMRDWSELKFKHDKDDQGMLDWAYNLRARAEKGGDFLSNHALGHIAAMHDDKFLRENWSKLRELLGGDDWVETHRELSKK